jgi:DNA polymerase-3 subunit epsilon
MPDYKADRDAAIRWARQILERDFVVIDTETTGLSYDDEAVSIGLVSKAGEVLLDTLLCHEKPCDPKALATHGVSWEATRAAPHFREIAPQIFELIAGKEVVAYNIQYDMRILTQMMGRYEITPVGLLPPVTFHDVMGAFAQFYGQWNDYHGSYTWKKLTYAGSYFNVGTDGAHGAAADCLITLRVLEAMAREKLSSEPI